MNNAQYINQTSGTFEYYTPSQIIDAARRVMGGIELDVASSAVADQTVQAERYYTIEDDSLSRDWTARTVWLNHPFSRQNNKKFIKKLNAHYLFGDVSQACCALTARRKRRLARLFVSGFACTSEQWFQPMFDYPLCYLSPRTNYFLPDGTKKKGALTARRRTHVPFRERRVRRRLARLFVSAKGSVVAYLGPSYNFNSFIKEFSPLGNVMIPAWWWLPDGGCHEIPG